MVSTPGTDRDRPPHRFSDPVFGAGRRRRELFARIKKGDTSVSQAELNDTSRPKYMRLTLFFMAPLSYGAYLAGKLHGVPIVLAAVLGAVGALTAIVLFLFWPGHASRTCNIAAVALVVGSYWPTIVVPVWAFFATCLGGLVLMGMWYAGYMYRFGAETDRMLDAMAERRRVEAAEAKQAQEAVAHKPMHFFRLRP